MAGGRQHNRSRPQVARKSITTPHHHHVHVRTCSSTGTRPSSLSNTPHYRKGGERLKERHEIRAGRKQLQLNKEKIEEEREQLQLKKWKEEEERIEALKWRLRMIQMSRFKIPLWPWDDPDDDDDVLLTTESQQLPDDQDSPNLPPGPTKKPALLSWWFHRPSPLMEIRRYPLMTIDWSGFDDSSSEQWSDANDELVEDDSVNPTL